MFIEEVIIDGFKSYAARTVISGFDPNFNAITGLNGTGKSNILDAICFVLGITNLSQVRVQNLQELVYKQGQAGITKASVTIVFNNHNKKQSPVGYEQFDQITVTRQVVVGGRNKYLINGHNAQPTRVQNLFHSVQLNVNNPHFLIMQGRITKVLNMKPPEILAMIEETAGTRMFEMKKIAALKTIEKKQNKVDEISRVLTEEITPTLERLRSERKHYMEWVNNSNEIERLNRFCAAYEYHKAEKTLQRSAQDLKALQDQELELANKAKSIAEALEKANEEIANLTKKKEKEMRSALKNLENEASQLSKELVKLNANWQHKKEALEAEQRQQQALKDSIAEAQGTIEQKKRELSKTAGKAKELELQASSLQSELTELERKYQAASVGMSADASGDGAKTLADQLADAKKAATSAVTEYKQLEMRLSHLTEELKQKKKQTSTASKDFTKLQSEYNAAVQARDKLKVALEKLDFNEDKERELLTLKKTEENAIRELREKVDDMSSRISGLQFVFSDPEKNFDRSKVKGLVADLINVKDPNAATALEVAAGARLFNVVVDNEQTAKLLLKNGQLKKRVTIIPLNKIVGKTVSPKAVKGKISFFSVFFFFFFLPAQEND